jgi:Activator of Hsp90 ATPase homolog 1-like protein
VTSRVLVALRVKATPARAFDVFTRDVASWWSPNAMFQFTPRSPGKLAFEAPVEGRAGRFTETLTSGKVFEIGTVKIWAPGERLVFGWRQATFAPGQDTEVEVRFEAVGEETRVTVEHRGWDSVPAEHVAKHNFPEAVFLRRHGEWWRDLLDALAVRAQTGGG